MSDMEDMQKAVHEINVLNGWFDMDRTFGDEIALLHSELSEALEAFRDWGLEDKTESECLKKYGVARHGALVHDVEERHICKPEGVGSEVADVLVRLLDLCERYNIDLESEFWRKVKYNKTRGYRHGGKAL